MRARQSIRIHKRLNALHRHPHFKTALHLIQTLQGKGFQTVLAGGSVRDSLLGRTPKDLDIATAAPPEVVESSFSHTLAIGKEFGTIVVVEGQENFEVTTFRREGPYTDGRHPDHVEFTDMIEDAKRRDFTVNALFYDPVKTEVLDFVGGAKDLSKRILRTVGDPEERFFEDRLRMLRAPRFVAQLGFVLDDMALRAIQNNSELLVKVSAERVFNEMRRLLSAPFVANGLHVLRMAKLEEVVWPEMARANLERFKNFTPLLSWENAFAAVMLLAECESAETRLRAWKASRESIRRVQSLMDGCRILMNSSSTRAQRVRVLGGENFAEILLLTQGFLHGESDVILSWIGEFLKVSGKTGALPQPLLNGQDLLSAGMVPGEKMGLLLKALYEEQLEGKIKSKAEALEKIKKY